jgi:hypothetical protein
MNVDRPDLPVRELQAAEADAIGISPRRHSRSAPTGWRPSAGHGSIRSRGHGLSGGGGSTAGHATGETA